jgi:hypothetical protein
MYSHPFQRWKSLHEALTGLVQDYRDTCILLQSECAQLPRSPADRAYLENAMSTLNSKLASIYLSEGQLLESRIVLQRTRNRSHLVAINSLPDEILAYVFALANCHCYYDSEDRYEPCQYGMSSPSVLAGVCQRWRRLAIGTPLLWSHIDLNLGGFISEPSCGSRGLLAPRFTFMCGSLRTLRFHIISESRTGT